MTVAATDVIAAVVALVAVTLAAGAAAVLGAGAATSGKNIRVLSYLRYESNTFPRVYLFECTQSYICFEKVYRNTFFVMSHTFISKGIP